MRGPRQKRVRDPARDFGLRNPPIANLLAEARRRAGFPTAAAAAAAYGWSDVTLRAHERGARRISPSDAEKYALAFGLPVEALEDSARASFELDRLRSRRSAAPTFAQSKEDVGRRLKIARLIRGFDTVRAAADEFGFAQPTLTAHEGGLNRVTERMSLTYAVAYGVMPAWLLQGIPPSGLGSRVDDLLAADPDGEGISMRELRRLVGTDAETDSLNRLLRDARWSGAAGLDGDDVPELSARQIGSEPSCEGFESRRMWKLPKGLAKAMVGSEAGALVVVSVEFRQGGLEAGDRVFVDVIKRDIREGGKFAYLDEGRLRVHHHAVGSKPASDRERLLGKVVGVFARA
jgi:hypothetical protein